MARDNNCPVCVELTQSLFESYISGVLASFNSVKKSHFYKWDIIISIISKWHPRLSMYLCAKRKELTQIMQEFNSFCSVCEHNIKIVQKWRLICFTFIVWKCSLCVIITFMWVLHLLRFISWSCAYRWTTWLHQSASAVRTTFFHL